MLQIRICYMYIQRLLLLQCFLVLGKFKVVAWMNSTKGRFCSAVEMWQMRICFIRIYKLSDGKCLKGSPGKSEDADLTKWNSHSQHREWKCTKGAQIYEWKCTKGQKRQEESTYELTWSPPTPDPHKWWKSVLNYKYKQDDSNILLFK